MTDEGRALDDERRSYHVAAHAVAMWKLGYGTARVSIDPHGAPAECATPGRSYNIVRASHPSERRFIVEEDAMVLLASSVAEQLLQPGSATTACNSDHRQLHELMHAAEDDGAVHIAWCNYLWQRTYTLLAWPGQWKLIVALARTLRVHRTLEGRAADHYLRRTDAALQRSPGMPNAVLVGEVTFVCSPWHRDWIQQCAETTTAAKRTDLPLAVEQLEPTTDLRPLSEALQLSQRARRGLERATIRDAIDLSYWSPRALASVKGLGPCTIAEIVTAAQQAGLTVPPDSTPYPWNVDPVRWR